MTEKIKINRIKVVLAEKDISQKELAKKVGKAPNTITRICNNESQPKLGLLTASITTNGASHISQAT